MKLGRRSEGVDERVCVYWLQGRCNRNPCRFLHRETLPPPQSAAVNRHKRTPPPPENAPIVLNKKSRVGSYSYSYSAAEAFQKPPRSVCNARTPPENTPKYNSNEVLNKKSRVGSYSAAEAFQKPSPSVSNARTPPENNTPNPKHNSNSKAVLIRKSGDETSCIAQASKKPSPSVSNARTPPENNTSKAVLIRKSGDGTSCIAQASKKPSLTLCKYWVTGNCTHGDRCLYLHSWHYGDGLSTIAKLHQHKKVVTGIALPTGSDKLYSGSTDGTLCTWDCHTGQCANLTNLGAEVTTLICEGPWIFVSLTSAVKVAVVKAWHIETASEFTLVGPKGRVLAMIVGNDTLCAAAEDGVISAWRGSSDPKSPFELVASLTGHTKAVSCLDVGAWKRLYSGSMDQTIKVWDLDTLECIMTLKGHTGEVTSLICWDNYLLSGSSDCTIKAWAATEDGSLEVTYTHTLDNGVVAFKGMNAEKTHILFCSCKDNSVRLLALPSFSERGRLFAKKEIRSIEIGPGGLFLTGDGTGLVMVSKWLEDSIRS